MGEKIENFTASFSEAIAQKRGRNTEWAIQAVRRSVSITEKEALKKIRPILPIRFEIKEGACFLR